MPGDGLPESLTLNAWTGEGDAASGAMTTAAARWGLTGRTITAPETLKPTIIPLTEWNSPEVGWGLLLADDDSIPEEDRAVGMDAPEPIRTLLAARGGSPVLRFRPDLPLGKVRRYYVERGPQDISISGSARGSGPGRLPRYLLIYGPPHQIPWEFQYVLSGPCMVGRLDLTGDALARYVDHLINDWNSAGGRVAQPVVWAVDWGGGDITSLMRRSIAEPIAQALRGDPQIGDGVRYVDGDAEEASTDALVNALTERQPSFVVTTSHGMTGPLDDEIALGDNLGRLVDQDQSVLDPEELCGAWQPRGAIWYAHACCSAGSAGASGFEDLVEEGSMAHRVLKGVAALGDHVAPLPTALMSAEEPLRAFIGHVEPTFDWTLRDPETGERLTTSIREALYTHLFQPEPLGLAFREFYKLVGELLGIWDQALKAFNRGEETRDAALIAQLAARDRQSTVILGDPTVTLPSLP